MPARTARRFADSRFGREKGMVGDVRQKTHAQAEGASCDRRTVASLPHGCELVYMAWVGTRGKCRDARDSSGSGAEAKRGKIGHGEKNQFAQIRSRAHGRQIQTI